VLSWKLTWNTARCNTSSKKSLKSFSWASRRGILRKSRFSALCRSSVPLTRPGRFRVNEEFARGRSSDIFRHEDFADESALSCFIRNDVSSLEVSSLAGMSIKRCQSVWTYSDENGFLYMLCINAVNQGRLPPVPSGSFSAACFRLCFHCVQVSRALRASVYFNSVQRIGSQGIPGKEAVRRFHGLIRAELNSKDNCQAMTHPGYQTSWVIWG